MKNYFALILMLLICLKSFSQNNKKVLLYIEDEPVNTSEFLALYQKNKNAQFEGKENDISEYLDLFVDYKLKVKEAQELQLDTVQKFKNELSQYKRKLVAPYLKDQKVLDSLVLEAYKRLQKEVKASHILIMLQPDPAPKDTLVAYNKLIEARNLVRNGSDFSTIAKEYSKDKSVAQNGGSLGYFSVLQMVYPFENVAYNTEIGSVSMPFSTKFGMHILKVYDVRPSKGQVEVAHIMLKGNSEIIKQRIDSIYQVIKTDNIPFEELVKQFSEDRASASKGGKLNKFSSNQIVESFSNVAFSLAEEGAYSEPFQTPYGWHIVKLLKKYPVRSFEEEKDDLLEKVEKDERSNLVSKVVVDRLSNQYNVEVFAEGLNQFKIDDWKESPEKFTNKLILIDNNIINQDKFITYLKTVNNTPVEKAFEGFKQQAILRYYTANIEKSDKEFAAMYKEFKEGMLLFEVLEKEVWEKSKDSIGLTNYFEEHKPTKFREMDLESDRGRIISDYQNYLEKKWVASLREKYAIRFNKSQKKKVLAGKMD